MFRTHISVVRCVFLLLFFCQFPVSAQEHMCDTAIKQTIDDQLDYQARSDRCEGSYKAPGVEIISLVSFTESFESYDLNSGQELVVEWDAPKAQQTRLRAKRLHVEPRYQMDSIRPAGETAYRWPLDVLNALKFPREQIGIVGWARYTLGEPRAVFLPLRISQQGKPGRAPKYRVVLWPEAELTEVYVSLASVDTQNGTLVEFLWEGKALEYGYYQSRRGIVFEIPKPEKPGVYYLEMGVLLKAGGSINVEYWFYHAG